MTRPAALLSPGGAEADPYQLTHALLRSGTPDGLEVYDRTELVKFESGHVAATGGHPPDLGGGARVQLITDRGHSIRARYAVFATGYETTELLAQHRIQLHST